MKYICKWWHVSITTSKHFSFGGKPLIELGVNNTKMTIFCYTDNLFCCHQSPSLRDDSILQILEGLRVCAANLCILIRCYLQRLIWGRQIYSGAKGKEVWLKQTTIFIF